MKRILSFISILALLITACEGDPGPPGPPGLDGVNFVGQSFERTVDFTTTNDYTVSVEIPSEIELLQSDMVLVYRLIDEVDGFDVWKLLPETVYIETGEEFQYNFEHNFDFVTLFIDAPATFDFGSLLDEERLGQTFRIVVLPVDFINNRNIDVSDFNEVSLYLE